MQTAVVFFSRDNNTRTGAKLIAARTGAKLVDLKEEKTGNVIQAVFKMSSRLSGSPWEDIRQARRVYLMTPIWGSRSTPAVNAFVKAADFRDKEVRIVTFQASPDLKGSGSVHAFLKKRVQAKAGTVSKCYAFVGAAPGKCLEEAEIERQIAKIFHG
jgi:flavodoxin